VHRFTAVFCAVLVAVAAFAVTISTPASASASAQTSQPRSAVKATKALSAVANPARNAVPSPDYNTPCWAGGAKGAANTTACRTQELAAINHQHALEHIRAITLPRNFWTLSPALQLFVITNLERVSRGLKPVLGVNAQMSSWALAAVKRSADVAVGAWDLTNGTQLQTFGSVWAADLNSLDAAFIWMYADGWATGGSLNADCTSAKSAGCWGHRKIMLGSFGGSGYLVAGVASLPHFLAGGDLNSDAAAIANYKGPTPKFTYTWAAAVAAGAH
jgi:hypothetical protein